MRSDFFCHFCREMLRFIFLDDLVCHGNLVEDVERLFEGLATAFELRLADEEVDLEVLPRVLHASDSAKP